MTTIDKTVMMGVRIFFTRFELIHNATLSGKVIKAYPFRSSPIPIRSGAT